MLKFMVTIAFIVICSSVWAADVFDIQMPEFGVFRNCENLIECKADLDCSTITIKKDTRNCRSCILKNPFGGCLQRGNDPICEAAKASQNAAYRANSAAEKLNCEVLKTQTVAACEANKLAMESNCEAKKELEKKSAREIEDKNKKLIDLSITADRLNLSDNLVTYLISKGWLKEKSKHHYNQYSENNTTYLKVLSYFRPNKYVNAQELVKIVGDTLPKVISVGNVTFVNVNYQLMVEDVIRATTIDNLYKQFGESGVSNLEASESIILSNYIDNIVIEKCEEMKTNNDQYKCNNNAELYK